MLPVPRALLPVPNRERQGQHPGAARGGEGCTHIQLQLCLVDVLAGLVQLLQLLLPQKGQLAQGEPPHPATAPSPTHCPHPPMSG